MKANYIGAMSKSKARQIAQEEVGKIQSEIYRDCASDIMQQTLANVLLCLERDYGWRGQRLRGFVKNLQGWIDIMSTSTPLTDEWTTTDNIEYFCKQYGIDLKKEFVAELISEHK